MTGPSIQGRSAAALNTLRDRLAPAILAPDDDVAAIQAAGAVHVIGPMPSPPVALAAIPAVVTASMVVTVAVPPALVAAARLSMTAFVLPRIGRGDADHADEGHRQSRRKLHNRVHGVLPERPSDPFEQRPYGERASSRLNGSRWGRAEAVHLRYVSVMFDPHEQIARLEAEIDELAEAADRCRKISIAAKVAVATGIPLLAMSMLGFLGPFALISGLSAALGGIALLGSNRRTWDDALADISLREAQRAELIDGLWLEGVQHE
jgi:hypothetical protein